jgi:catechol 2,3-dioxygenase-like lactoylglutathione lyase family enzyme
MAEAETIPPLAMTRGMSPLGPSCQHDATASLSTRPPWAQITVEIVQLEALRLDKSKGLLEGRFIMRQTIGYIALVVRDYDEAINFYVRALDFVLIEDTFIEAQNKRWVLLAPPGSTEARLLLARAVGPEQESRIVNQTGGRVFLFLHTDDFWRDFRRYKERGVVFVREPKDESYGTVAVFQDLYGNRWDLLQPKP